ncbi:hypothetical protein KEM56_002416 [Ascosphaera pollenicola]|nr:hypothetical protein KEM56_002416 [Ascosphaera pollenicola]
MSASPTSAHASSKRPLEDPSSPSGQTEQPEAKRPALDKVSKESRTNGDKTNAHQASPSTAQSKDASIAVAAEAKQQPATEQTSEKSPAGADVTSTPAGAAESSTATTAAQEPQPIQSTSAPQAHATDETGWIHIRAIISMAEAATCIGKNGENVSQIRRLSGAKCTVSEYQRNAVERILTVSGPQDAVAKAFGLIIRTLNNEPLEAPSTAQSKTYPLRLLIPHILIGSIIGKGGTRIREIQDASGARLNASDACLPLSTERSLVILGVADAVHIATYYVAVTLVEQLTERFGGPAASAYATRSGAPVGVVPGGMQVVPYVPQAAGGQYGNPESYRRHHPQAHRATAAAATPYGMSPYPMAGGAAAPVAPVAQPTLHYGGPRAGYVGAGPHQPSPYGASPAQPLAAAAAAAAPAAAAAGVPTQPMGGAVPGQPTTQQIYIPNDMVGAIIGKGGAKINEIRQLSGSVIKINEPQDNSNERLVTITGTQECNQMALYMLYSRLESEKHRI